jgi:hypothetical protein
MKARNRHRCSPAVVGSVDDIIPEDDTHLTTEQYMDREFGRGWWVRDTWCDRFIVQDLDHVGPGVGYLVFDRQRRCATTVVLPHQIN